MKAHALDIREIPSPVVTVKEKVPGLYGGAVTVICVGESTWMVVAGVPPNSTDTRPTKFVPVTITVSVPSLRITFGLRPVTVGAGIYVNSSPDDGVDVP